MSELRQRMIDEMTLRGFSPRTHESYLGAVKDLARYYNQPPDRLSTEQVRQYLLYLERERHLSWSSLNVAASGLRFFYFDTLKWQPVQLDIPPRTTPRRLPEVLTREEVDRLISMVLNLKHRALLMTIYAAGLRVSEAVALHVHDIDSARMTIRVVQGKGRKDRLWAMAHKRSYVPGKVMCSGRTQHLRRQAPGSDCPAHNYLPLNEAMSLSAGRKEPRFRVEGRMASSISRFCEGSARR